MNTLAFRRPETTLQKACPAYREALDAYEAAVARDDEAAMQSAWLRVTEIAEVFWQGAEYASTQGRVAR